MVGYMDIVDAVEAQGVVTNIVAFGAVLCIVGYTRYAVHFIGSFFDDARERRAHAAWSERMQEIGRQHEAGNTAEVIRLVDKERSRG